MTIARPRTPQDTTGDESGEVLTDATEFPDDLTDLTESSPGLVSVFETGAVSAAGLTDVETDVTVASVSGSDDGDPSAAGEKWDRDRSLAQQGPRLLGHGARHDQCHWKSSADGTRSIAGQTIVAKRTQ
jgi:hypothetical protein